MSELEKKFKKYMSNRWGVISKQSEIIVHDLAEIAKKERDLWYEGLAEKGNKAVSNLLKVNTELKADLERAKEDYQCSNDYVSLCEENYELKKQIENYKKEVINVIEGSALDIEFKSDNQELVDRINKIDVRTK